MLFHINIEQLTEGGVLAKFGDLGFSEHFSIQIDLRDNRYEEGKSIYFLKALLKTNSKINIWCL